MVNMCNSDDVQDEGAPKIREKVKCRVWDAFFKKRDGFLSLGLKDRHWESFDGSLDGRGRFCCSTQKFRFRKKVFDYLSLYSNMGTPQSQKVVLIQIQI